MRPIHLTDLDCAVRVILTAPDADWPNMVADLVQRARLADRYRKRKRNHLAHHGDGTLTAAALNMAAPLDPLRCDARYCRALITLLLALTNGGGFDLRIGALYEKERMPVEERNHGTYKSQTAST